MRSSQPHGVYHWYVLSLSPLTSAPCLEDVLCLRKSCFQPKGSRPRTVNGSNPGLGCGCTEGMVPPHAVMVLVVQSLSPELGLSPRPDPNLADFG